MDKTKKAKSTLTSLKNLILWIYFQYELVTGIYIFEPFEIIIANTFMISFLGFFFYMCYTLYFFARAQFVTTYLPNTDLPNKFIGHQVLSSF